MNQQEKLDPRRNWTQAEFQREHLYQRATAAMNLEQQTKFNDEIDAMREVVDAIEDNPMPITKDNYGEYLRLATDTTAVLVLICAGANQNGVISAARINGVL